MSDGMDIEALIAALAAPGALPMAGDGLTQVVGNNASYGPYVQGDEDQAAFHTARGWQTVGQVAEAEAETVTQFVADQIEKAIGGS